MMRGEFDRRGAAFGGEDRSDARVGGRCFGSEVGPGLQVLECIDDATTNLAVFRAGAVGAMLFEGAAGEAKEARRFGRAQKARRQAGQWIGHDRASVVLRRTAR